MKESSFVGTVILYEKSNLRLQWAEYVTWINEDIFIWSSGDVSKRGLDIVVGLLIHLKVRYYCICDLSTKDNMFSASSERACYLLEPL